MRNQCKLVLRLNKKIFGLDADLFSRDFNARRRSSSIFRTNLFNCVFSLFLFLIRPLYLIIHCSFCILSSLNLLKWFPLGLFLYLSFFLSFFLFFYFLSFSVSCFCSVTFQTKRRRLLRDDKDAKVFFCWKKLFKMFLFFDRN